MIEKRVKLVYDFGGVDAVYATNFTVQLTQHECTIMFFESKAPVIIGTDEEKTAQIERLDQVTADCVARVVISPGRAQELVGALQTVLEAKAQHDE